MSDELEANIRKIVPEDGDVIVITMKRSVPMAMHERLAQRLESLVDKIGKRVHFLVLEDDIGIHVLSTSRLPDAEPK